MTVKQKFQVGDIVQIGLMTGRDPRQITKAEYTEESESGGFGGQWYYYLAPTEKWMGEWHPEQFLHSMAISLETLSAAQKVWDDATEIYEASFDKLGAQGGKATPSAQLAFDAAWQAWGVVATAWDEQKEYEADILEGADF